MGWDSNPRNAFTFGGFQDRYLKPLGHPSAARNPRLDRRAIPLKPTPCWHRHPT